MRESNGDHEGNGDRCVSCQGLWQDQFMSHARFEWAEAIALMLVEAYRARHLLRDGLPLRLFCGNVPLDIALHVDVQHVMAHLARQALAEPEVDMTQPAVISDWVKYIADARLAREIEWECHLYQLSLHKRTSADDRSRVAPSTRLWDATIPPVYEAGERKAAKWLRGQPIERRQDASIAGMQGIQEGLRAFGQAGRTSCRCRRDGALTKFLYTSMLNAMRDELGIRSRARQGEHPGVSGSSQDVPPSQTETAGAARPSKPNKPKRPARPKRIPADKLTILDDADSDASEPVQTPEDETIKAQLIEACRDLANWASERVNQEDNVVKQRVQRALLDAAMLEVKDPTQPMKPGKIARQLNVDPDYVSRVLYELRGELAIALDHRHPGYVECFARAAKRLERMVRPLTPEVRHYLERLLTRLDDEQSTARTVIELWIQNTDQGKKTDCAEVATLTGTTAEQVDHILSALTVDLRERFHEWWDQLWRETG